MGTELELQGKTAIITGGSKGIGLAVAEGLAAEGYLRFFAQGIKIVFMPRRKG